MNALPRLLLALLLAGAVLAPLADRPPGTQGRERGEPGSRPSDWFLGPRAWPLEVIPEGRFEAAFQQLRLEKALGTDRLSGGGLTWEEAGPYNIGGRVTALAVVPGGQTVYLGAAAGGVFKSLNGGVNWTPVFDEYGAFSIGAVALDPTDPQTVYVGTGEANASVDSYDGAGLFRSRDGGQTWQHLGLAETRRIARVAVDPSEPQRVFVAAMGGQFSTGPDRGLYRSEDGGQSFQKVLFLNDSTGVCEVVIHPTSPETVYAATWERVRRPSYRRAYGPGCGIWRSADHGTSWQRLQAGLPAPSDSVGRIALAIATSRPSTVYAQIVEGFISGTTMDYGGRGLYRSEDGGESWTRRDLAGFTDLFGGFGWYFGDMAVDPANPEKLYALGVEMAQSIDGGALWSPVTGNAHVDFHAVWIDPGQPGRIYVGNDGGFYRTESGAGSWVKSVDLPITQFYAGSIDPSNPQRLIGGTQDNGSMITAGDPRAWSFIFGGDGFYCLIHPDDPNIVFAEYQFCSYGTGPRRSVNGGASFAGAPPGFVTTERYNWNAPFVMNPRNPNVLLAGSYRVYRSLDNGRTYGGISPNLTTNPPAAVVYGTISTLAISAADTSLYFAGTDDGKVWRSQDRGANWQDITAGLPRRSVTRVTPDPLNPQVVYVTLSGFNLDEAAAHVYRSADRGMTWAPIDGNLPDIPANDLLVDPADTRTLYLATDIGVWASRDLGAGWFPLGVGMPVQTVFDLTLHAPSRTLVAATHGRSQWRLDLSALPVAAGPGAPAARLALSAPHPNPSRGAVRFALELPAASAVEVAIYDLGGRRVRTLHRGPLETGRHDLTWDGGGAAGRRAAPGVYFARATAGVTTDTRRIVLTD
jgi:photosystem II stability/assembly factor-like uncharacterized protein